MADADEGTADFEFDPDQLSELGDLAEAFIHEEVDAALLGDLDREYLQRLVDHAGRSHLPAWIQTNTRLQLRSLNLFWIEWMPLSSELQRKRGVSIARVSRDTPPCPEYLHSQAWCVSLGTRGE